MSPEDGTVFLTVVLPVHNGAASMSRQLDALIGQECLEPWEILVVDNASTDASAAVAATYAARFDRVRVVAASGAANLGYARNVGVAQASGQVVAFCDDDDVVGVGWVSAMAHALHEHDIVACCMEYEELSEPTALTGHPAFQSEVVELLFGRPIVNGASGWNRALWLMLGGNDEDFYAAVGAGEDHEMALRAGLQTGATPVLVHDAIYHCRRRAGGRATFRQARRYGQSHVLLYRRFGRQLGAPPPTVRAVAARWWWLLSHLGAVMDPARRTLWAWRAGQRIGRAQGSLRFHIWYP